MSSAPNNLSSQAYSSSRQEVDPTPSVSLGAMLSSKVENAYQKARALLPLVACARQPTRFANALYTFTSGVGHLLSGNPVGILGLWSGGCEVYNMTSPERSNTLQNSLSDISADAEMIERLAQTQNEHYVVIDANLEAITADVRELYGKLSTIQEVNTQGIEELQESKKRAVVANQKAIRLFKKAEKLFFEAQRSAKHSRAIFDKCGGLFREILRVAQSEVSQMSVAEKVSRIEELSQQAVRSCANGQGRLTEADRKFAEAFAVFQEANTVKAQAIVETAIAVQKAEDTFKATQEKASYTQACTNKITEAQKELEKAKEDAGDIILLVGALKRDVVRAKEAARSMWTNTELVAGLAVGVTVAPMVAPLTAVGSGVAAAYGVHHRVTVFGTAKRVYNYFSGVEEPAPVRLPSNELVRVVFDDVSSGLWGTVMKRRSHTVGNFYINLGDQQLSYRFNLNDEFPITKEDLLSLFDLLLAKVGNHSLDPARCLAIVNELRTVRLERGETQEDRIGVISPQDCTRAIVRKLEEHCKKQIVK